MDALGLSQMVQQPAKEHSKAAAVYQTLLPLASVAAHHRPVSSMVAPELSQTESQHAKELSKVAAALPHPSLLASAQILVLAVLAAVKEPLPQGQHSELVLPATKLGARACLGRNRLPLCLGRNRPSLIRILEAAVQILTASP